MTTVDDDSNEHEVGKAVSSSLKAKGTEARTGIEFQLKSIFLKLTFICLQEGKNPVPFYVVSGLNCHEVMKT